MQNQIISLIRQRFSFGWSKFAKSEITRKWYKDSFSYLNYIPKRIFSGQEKLGLDAGCGSGADLRNIAQLGARIFGIDISDSVNITGKNVADLKNISVMQADIFNLPFKDEIFDFAYSFGVLHHLPNPEKGFRILCSKVKKGGTVIIYVYEDFSERSPLEQRLLKIVNSLRVITTRIPPSLLYFISILMAPIVILCCCLPYQILRRIPGLEGFSEKLPFRHTINPNCIVADLYDRFSPPVEFRYNRKEIEEWFRKANLRDVHVINYRGWVVWGERI